jgi:GntR family transcriptional regulator, transcriptional repressor for pyruvate dehydrogenase complex
MFNKARQVRASEDIYKQIEDAILSGKLHAGNRLPPERELQVTMGVSRNTLRESFRVLENKGLIEIRQGNRGGVFVREINSDQMTASLLQFVRSKQISLQQMSEFRQDLEGIVTARAAKAATPKNIETACQLLEKAETLARKGVALWDEFMEVDKEIHFALADVAGNPLHRFFMETIHNSFYLPRTQEVIDTCLQSLKDMLDAVSQHDTETAKLHAEKHVEYFNQFMEDVFLQKQKNSDM